MQTPRNTEKVINKIKRISVVVFLKRFIYLLIIIALTALSVLLGLWNVRKVEYDKEDLKYSSVENIEKGIEYLKGSNIFSIDPIFVEQQLRKENPFIKSVEVDKVVPSRLVLKIYEHVPEFIYYTGDNCNLYSQTGFKIESLCENCGEECSGQKETYSSVYVASENPLESEGTFIYWSELTSFVRLLSEFGYDISEVSIKDGVTVLISGDNSFIFDLNQGLDIQMSRMYLVGEKINQDSIKFLSLDLRFERPILKTE